MNLFVAFLKLVFLKNKWRAIAAAFREANLEAEIVTKADLRELEYWLNIKLGTMIVVAIGVVATLVRLL